MLKYDIFRTVDELHALSSEWNSVLERSRSNTIFLTWQWLSTWLAVCGSPLQLFVIAIRDENRRLVGIAPFYKSEYRLFGAIHSSCLRIIGDDNTAAEYGNFIVDRLTENDVLAQMMNVLHQHREEWDFVWLHDFPQWSAGSRVVVDTIDQSQLSLRGRTKPFSYLPLPDTFEDFLANASANQRRSMKRADQDILQMQSAHIAEPSNDEDLAAALLILTELHQKRWNQLGQRGSFAKLPMLKKFHDLFASRALNEGWLKLYILQIDGRPIAAQYGFIYNDVFSQLLEGIDPDYSAGAGSALRVHVIQNLCNRGVSEYDFLGGYSSHKKRWGALERSGCDLFVTNKRLASLSLQALPLWPNGRFLKTPGNAA